MNANTLYNYSAHESGMLPSLVQIPRTPSVHVNTVPGTYSVTAAKYGQELTINHVVRVGSGQSVSLTIDV